MYSGGTFAIDVENCKILVNFILEDANGACNSLYQTNYVSKMRCTLPEL